MGRKRSKPENKGLPQGWSYRHGAYYFCPAPSARHHWDGKSLFRLGSTLSESHCVYAGRIARGEGEIQTIGQLLDRYLVEALPKFSPTSQRAEKVYIRTLRKVFGDLGLFSLTPQMVYAYVDKRTAKVSAKNEVACLSNAYTHALQWGLIPTHPFKGQVRLKGIKKPRDRYVTDDEVKAIYGIPDTLQSYRMVKAYVRLKLLTGCRKSDLLRIQMTDIDHELRMFNNKSSKPMVFEMTSALKAAIEQCKAIRPVLSPWLFCTRKGECMVTLDGRTDAFDRAWVKARLEAKVDFTEHDLRRKVASDSDTLDRASELLGHADTRVTKRHYRAKVNPIKPVK